MNVQGIGLIKISLVFKVRIPVEAIVTNTEARQASALERLVLREESEL